MAPGRCSVHHHAPRRGGRAPEAGAWRLSAAAPAAQPYGRVDPAPGGGKPPRRRRPDMADVRLRGRQPGARGGLDAGGAALHGRRGGGGRPAGRWRWGCRRWRCSPTLTRRSKPRAARRPGTRTTWCAARFVRSRRPNPISASSATWRSTRSTATAMTACCATAASSTTTASRPCAARPWFRLRPAATSSRRRT